MSTVNRPEDFCGDCKGEICARCSGCKCNGMNCTCGVGFDND